MLGITSGYNDSPGMETYVVRKYIMKSTGLSRYLWKEIAIEDSEHYWLMNFIHSLKFIIPLLILITYMFIDFRDISII